MDIFYEYKKTIISIFIAVFFILVYIFAGPYFSVDMKLIIGGLILTALCGVARFSGITTSQKKYLDEVAPPLRTDYMDPYDPFKPHPDDQ